MFVIELVKNEENIETIITQAIHLLIQVTNNYTMSYCYSQNDNLVFTVRACDVCKTNNQLTIKYNMNQVYLLYWYKLLCIIVNNSIVIIKWGLRENRPLLPENSPNILPLLLFYYI